MFNHVSWDKDLMDLEALFAAEYEKCNIWPPFADRGEMLQVMDEEIEELQETCKSTVEWAHTLMDNEDPSMDDNLIAQIYGSSAKTICEALQLVAVCNKYLQRNDVEAEMVQEIVTWLDEVGFGGASKALEREYGV